MKRVFIKFVFLILIILLIVSSFILSLGFLKYKYAITKISLQDKVKEIQNQDSYIKLENISDTYIDAVIAVEDHRFYEHKGVDYFSLFRSTYINIKRKSLDYGASTITQQVRKTFIFFSRKKYL